MQKPVLCEEFQGDAAGRGLGGLIPEREREVVRLIAEGKSSKEIGRVLAISPRTVDT